MPSDVTEARRIELLRTHLKQVEDIVKENEN